MKKKRGVKVLILNILGVRILSRSKKEYNIYIMAYRKHTEVTTETTLKYIM